LKLSGDPLETVGQMAGDVLDENKGRSAFANNAGDLGPEVAGVVFSTALAGDAEPLAGISRSDDIHRSTPRCAVEGSHIIPDRCSR
jgi:hypothetical protein